MATRTKARTVSKNKPTAVKKNVTSRTKVTSAHVTSNKAAGSSSTSFRQRFSFVRPVYQPRTAYGALIAEVVGTFALAAVWLNVNGSAIAILFVLTALTLVGMQLSGSHFNPAITVGMWVTRQISTLRMAGYVVAQVLGAMLALLVVTALLPIQPAQQSFSGAAASSVVYTVPALVDGKEWYIFFAQMLGTATFAFAFASAYFGRKAQAASAIVIGFGFYVGLILATASSYAVLNPAVAISLSALKWEVWPLAVYVAAPLIGGLVGIGLYKLLQNDVQLVEERLVKSVK